MNSCQHDFPTTPEPSMSSQVPWQQHQHPSGPSWRTARLCTLFTPCWPPPHSCPFALSLCSLAAVITWTSDHVSSPVLSFKSFNFSWGIHRKTKVFTATAGACWLSPDHLSGLFSLWSSHSTLLSIPETQFVPTGLQTWSQDVPFVRALFPYLTPLVFLLPLI